MDFVHSNLCQVIFVFLGRSFLHSIRYVDTVCLQKKVLTGSDRLKRLTMAKSILKRRGTMFRKHIINLKKKFFFPFTKMKLTFDSSTIRTPLDRSIGPPVLKNDQRGPLQILSINQQMNSCETEKLICMLLFVSDNNVDEGFLSSGS